MLWKFGALIVVFMQTVIIVVSYFSTFYCDKCELHLLLLLFYFFW